MRILLVGSGGRESVFAWKLYRDNKIFVVMQHRNPSIIEYAEESGGGYIIGNILDGKQIANYAVEKRIDLAFINSDAPLEAGVIDCLSKVGIKTVGPDRLGAEIEWNKSFAMRLFQKYISEYTPKHWIAEQKHSIDDIFNHVTKANIPVVVKPSGLTGGKGVKVMGEHLSDYDEARQYAYDILEDKIGNISSVVIEEKLEGKEFTMQIITDGKTVIKPPATYDHPYRYDFDRGPGTGGMGAFSDVRFPLPFMSQNDYDICIKVIQKIIHGMENQGRHFNGVLNPGLFLTPNGIRIMEVNARCGDPEAMNIMLLLDVPLTKVLTEIVTQSLQPHDEYYKHEASIVKYLVAPEYAIKAGKPHTFFLDKQKILSEGVQVFFSAAEVTDRQNTYRTVGNSRVVALATTDKSIPKASKKIDQVIERYIRGPLEFRKDIGTRQELARLSKI